MKNKITVLILTPYFLPGFKAGGPIQSLKNLIDHLSQKINFLVVTPNHDLGTKEKYQDVETDRWNSIRGIQIYYHGSSFKSLLKLFRIIKKSQYDIRYYNSFFYPMLTIYPLILEKMGWLHRKPSILTPRGEFAPSALNLKGAKKSLYLKFIKVVDLYSNVHWHVSSQTEKKQLLDILDVSLENNIDVIPNLPPIADIRNERRISSKQVGKLRLIFASRIAKNKNLLEAISFLNNIKGQVKFDIYGPKEDESYFKECMNLAQKLPSNVNVQYKDAVEHSQISSTLRNYDFLLFPTKNENFGHIILESFLAGTPVIISNRTPWLELEKKQAGWDISLSQKEQFKNVIQICVQMGKEKHQKLCDGALKVAREYLENEEIVNQTYNMFAKLVKLG